MMRGKPEAYRYVLRQRRNSSQNILRLQRDDRRDYQPKEHEEQHEGID